MLLVISLILLVIGLIVVYAISPGLAAQKNVSDNYYVGKQLLAVLLGLGAFTVVAHTPLKWWRHLEKPLIVGALVATFVALILPVSPEYPAHRWIRLGSLSLQSVEVIKLALAIGLASFLADRIKRGVLGHTKQTLQPLFIGLGVIGFIVAVLQADLGSAGVLVAMAGAMAYVAGLPMKRILQVGAVRVVCGLWASMSTPYRRDRVATFLNPQADCQNAGYQACQALIAVGSGGLLGKGLGHGAQAYGYLPEAANDSIFAIMAEKFGFVGVVILLCLFIGLFSRLVRILERAPDDFSRLVVAGVLAWLSTQALINIGAMIGLLPLKGITLPFISSGGTSIIFMLAAVGLVFNISRYTTFGVLTDYDNRSGGEPAPRTAVSYRSARRA
jgi:cell division protein FtsW